MKFLRPVVSDKEPNLRDALWLKPTENGFVAYVLKGGSWKPLEADGEEGEVTMEDVTASIKCAKSKLIGSVQDSKNANTINGAKNYAKDQIASLKGSTGDTASDLTLYGLKKYIDAKIAASDK